MRRRVLSVLGGAATAALLATALQTPAQAAPPADRATKATKATKADDRADKLDDNRRALNKKAVELVLKGDRQVEDRNGSKAVKVAPGQWAQYGLQSSDNIFSTLVEFSENTADKDARFPTAPVGPKHNKIPAPDRAVDNTTYWTADFNRAHYLDMFFNGQADLNGQSMKALYEEMSSGRYTVDGDVGDWVTVNKNEASYGETESHADMTRFIDDGAEAWYAAQVAAGKSTAQIKSYLASFDKWDRYDSDNDGNFNEADGYIDHYQAIHAGEGEEAGAPSWAIWSHRWAVNQDGRYKDGIGPDGYGKSGGIEIGDTNMWIRDYTTEPENGGLGVFAHEYGHDLGLDDYYDTAGGENGTGFWTLMSSGSWLNHGKDTIGTTPNHMGGHEKLLLGWLDYDQASSAETSEHKLGPSYHATKKSQALVVTLPDHTVFTDIGAAAEGSDYFYSGRQDNANATLTSPAFTVPAAGQLAAKVNYQTEKDWDYAYAEVSEDGGNTFVPLLTNLSTETDPNGQNDGHGITGSSANQWVNLTASMASYAGKSVKLRFRMFTDGNTNGFGLKVDAISVGTALNEGAENGAPGWTMDTFVIAENGTTKGVYSHYYIAENRQYLGYDGTLAEGPYNFGWGTTKPDFVEHFPYQNGLLVTYVNGQYTDNNTSVHPGGGEALPVDANPTALRWSDNAVARNRIQSFDSTFGLERTDAISLHRETAAGMTTLNAPSRPGVTVFDDTNPMAYYDAANPGGSVKVAGSGTTLRVLDANRNGMMTVLVN